MGSGTAIVTVIIDGKPSVHTIQALDGAIRQQTDFPVEILLTSRCLDDSLRRKLNQLDSETQQRVKLLPPEGSAGTHDSLGAALEHCSGRFIALLGCDDYWTATDKLQRQVDHLERHPECALSFHRVRCEGEDGRCLPELASDDIPEVTNLDHLLQLLSILPSSALIRADAVYPPPPRLKQLRHPARLLYLQASMHGTIGYLDETLSGCRLNPDGREQPADPVHDCQELILVLRHMRNRRNAGEYRQINRKVSDLHWLMSHEMDRLGRDSRADRHRRLCFLYAGWRSRLPVRTKISHTIRPCRVVHSIAVFAFETIRYFVPTAFFATGLILRQPSRLGSLAMAVFRHGMPGLRREWRIIEYLHAVSRQRYRRWIRHYDTLTDNDRTAIGRRIEQMPLMPVFSVIIPVGNTSEEFLASAIDSVIRQLYSSWDLCIAASAAAEPGVRTLLNQAARSDSRIRCVSSGERGDTATATEMAVDTASGDFAVFLNPNDELAEQALYWVAEQVNSSPDVQIIYSDEDRLDTHGRRFDPYFKTDWNPDLMLSHNLIGHLAVFRRELIAEAGGFQADPDDEAGYDLALRCIEQVAESQIRHIPGVLYHVRQVPRSMPAHNVRGAEAGTRAIKEHLARQSIDASVESISDLDTRHYRVRYAIRVPPLVTVIVPTRDRLHLLQRCVDGLLNKTEYPSLEILIVDNQSCEPDTLAYFTSLKQHDCVKILKFTGEFNYSAINNFAVGEAAGDVICLLNNDIEMIDPDWLREMVSHAVRNEIGAVGAKLLYPDDCIQHAGVTIGYRGLSGHTFVMLPAETPVQRSRLHLTQSVSCVTAACLVLRKSVFMETGGLDEEAFAVAYNDIDLCLRIVAAGYRIVWTPWAQLYHHESATRGDSPRPEDLERDRREAGTLRRRWKHAIAADPNLNPNISVDHLDFRPAFPPRTRKPWQ